MESSTIVIDSSILIEYLRAKDKRATTLFNIPDNTKVCISAVTLYELYIGATNEPKWNDVKLLTNDLILLPFNEIIAIESAKIFHELRKSNTMIEFRDIFIAATCKIHNLPIKTLNKNHYKRINGITVE
jgi:predicted nucleic acid-binding protein